MAERTAGRIAESIGTTLERELGTCERRGGPPSLDLYRAIRLLEIVAGSTTAAPLLGRVMRLGRRAG
jgi:hypothetical protein